MRSDTTASNIEAAVAGSPALPCHCARFVRALRVATWSGPESLEPIVNDLLQHGNCAGGVTGGAQPRRDVDEDLERGRIICPPTSWRHTMSIVMC